MFLAVALNLLIPYQSFSAQYDPYAVKAVVDMAVIIGLPASREAKIRLTNTQKSELIVVEAGQSPPPLGWRKQYFRMNF